ncbi:MAG: HEPN domain-containing protein [Candidatus Altiarchaeales archaeon]|nr:HEPN domain-containing protein [Candidatus Altiarchaeales archaeon]
MDYKFKKCMEEQKLIKTKPDQGMIEKELKGAEYDLKRAENSLAERDYKWAIIQSYYSMFHAVKALVLNKGYREKTHYCLLVAFKNLYIDTNLIESQFLEVFEESMDLRQAADYGLTYSKESAEQAIQNTKELLKKTREILGNM